MAHSTLLAPWDAQHPLQPHPQDVARGGWSSVAAGTLGLVLGQFVGAAMSHPLPGAGRAKEELDCGFIGHHPHPCASSSTTLRFHEK